MTALQICVYNVSLFPHIQFPLSTDHLLALALLRKVSLLLCCLIQIPICVYNC